MSTDPWQPVRLTADHVWTLMCGKAIRFEVNIDTPKMLEVLDEEL